MVSYMVDVFQRGTIFYPILSTPELLVGYFRALVAHSSTTILKDFRLMGCILCPVDVGAFNLQDNDLIGNVKSCLGRS